MNGLRASCRAYFRRYRERRSRPADVIRRADGTLWTTARVTLAEALEDLHKGGVWIFERIVQDDGGAWIRTGSRWKTHDSVGWEVLVGEGKLIRGKEYFEGEA